MATKTTQIPLLVYMSSLLSCYCLRLFWLLIQSIKAESRLNRGHRGQVHVYVFRLITYYGFFLHCFPRTNVMFYWNSHLLCIINTLIVLNGSYSPHILNKLLTVIICKNAFGFISFWTWDVVSRSGWGSGVLFLYWIYMDLLFPAAFPAHLNRSLKWA